MASVNENPESTLRKDCSFDKPVRTCDHTCFACTVMHGLDNGKEGGLWATTGVPKKYKGTRKDNLPMANDNPKAHKVVTRYMDNILGNVQEKNIGLYLYSEANKENPYGTGTGKTTTATAILNEYMIAKAKEYFAGRQDMDRNPAIFVKSTELQNAFNGQFRGTFEQKERSSKRYYSLKEKLKTYELVVMDDIATRGSRISEAFEDELYEIIDYRSSMIDDGAIVFTSNVSPEKMAEVLGERIASRITGMAVAIAFKGEDKRKESLLNG